MEIASNTLQLGMYPVDRDEYEQVKEYFTTFGLSAQFQYLVEPVLFFLIDNTVNFMGC